MQGGALARLPSQGVADRIASTRQIRSAAPTAERLRPSSHLQRHHIVSSRLYLRYAQSSFLASNLATEAEGYFDFAAAPYALMSALAEATRTTSRSSRSQLVFVEKTCSTLVEPPQVFTLPRLAAPGLGLLKVSTRPLPAVSIDFAADGSFEVQTSHSSATPA
jgi:hypothetical protein